MQASCRGIQILQRRRSRVAILYGCMDNEYLGQHAEERFRIIAHERKQNLTLDRVMVEFQMKTLPNTNTVQLSIGLLDMNVSQYKSPGAGALLTRFRP